MNPKLPANQSSMMAGQTLPHLVKGPCLKAPSEAGRLKKKKIEEEEMYSPLFSQVPVSLP